MSKITVYFIKCALIYLLVSIIIGIYMSGSGPQYPYKQIHTHFNLLGWMSMMIYGVAYHILPRFSGRPLWSEKLATAHLYLANIGLLGMALGWILMSAGWDHTVHAIFSVVETIAILFFVINMFKTVKAAPPIIKPTPK